MQNLILTKLFLAEIQYSRDNFVDKLSNEFPFVKVLYGLPQYEHIFNNSLPKLFLIGTFTFNQIRLTDHTLNLCYKFNI